MYIINVDLGDGVLRYIDGMMGYCLDPSKAKQFESIYKAYDYIYDVVIADYPSHLLGNYGVEC